LRTFEFLNLVIQNIPLYLVLWILTFSAYRMLFSKIVDSIFDPLYFYIIFTNSICTANLIFLGFLGEINNFYLTNYFVSEFALLLGVLIISKKPIHIQTPSPESQFSHKLHHGMRLATTIIVITNLIIYFERGIPLFMESRAEASTGGSGFGFILRISQTLTILLVIFYYSRFLITNGKTLLSEKIYLGTSVIIGILSGFKAFFLIYLFCYCIIIKKETLHKNKFNFSTLYKLCGSGIIMLALFAVVMGTSNFAIIISGLIARLLASGDVYYMAYVNDTLNALPKQNFFFQLFGSTLASFHLISWKDAPENYGYVLNYLINHNEVLNGPTFRYNVLWLHLTHNTILTTILSFFVGLIIGLFNKLLNSKRKLDFMFILLCFFYIKSFKFILGPDAAINDIIISILILIAFFTIMLVTFPANSKLKSTR